MIESAFAASAIFKVTIFIFGNVIPLIFANRFHHSDSASEYLFMINHYNSPSANFLRLSLHSAYAFLYS